MHVMCVYVHVMCDTHVMYALLLFVLHTGGGGGGQRFTDNRSVRGPPIQQQMSMEGMSDGLEQDNTEVILVSWGVAFPSYMRVSK